MRRETRIAKKERRAARKKKARASRTRVEVAMDMETPPHSPVPAREPVEVIDMRAYNNLPQRMIVSSPFIQRRLVSYGLAVFAVDTRRWLLVKPSCTPNLSCFMRGYYRLAELPNFLKHVSSEERLAILSLETPEDYVDYFLSLFPGMQRDTTYAVSRFMACKERAREILLGQPEREGSETDIEWTWPKGRRQGSEETPFAAACREFCEETGISAVHVKIISSEPVSLSYWSNNTRVYETTTWVGYVEKEMAVEHPEAGEISARDWKTPDEIRALFSTGKASHDAKLAHFESLLEMVK